MKTRFWFGWLMLFLLLVACGGGTETGDETAPAGPIILRVGWPGSPDSLNPGIGLLVESYTVWALTYDTLIDLNFDGTFKPNLAESYENSADGLTWTFHLRPDTKFHDGQPLTAQDVLFSLNFYQEHTDFPLLNSYTNYFDTITTPDEQTVVLTLTEAIPNLEIQVLSLFILPKHIWQAHSQGNAAAEFENLETIGSGPFKMVEYKQNEFVHLAANKEHFLYPPNIDEVIFQTFANEDALVQALQTGQVDLITEMPNTAYPILRNAENVQVVNGTPLSPSVRDIIFNQVLPENCPTEEEGGVCTGHPALLDRNVRLALAQATDKAKIIDVALLGLGTPGRTLIPDSQGVWYNSDLADHPFDPTQANQLLDTAGYLDSDGDGIRNMPDGGRPLTFRLQWPDDVPEAPRIADLLGEMWAEIGVKTEPQALNPDALTSICCPAFDFDIIIWGWAWGPDPNDPLATMITDEIATGYSETGYSNPQFDELYYQQATELDKEQRRQIVWQMQEIIFNDVVYLIPYYAQTVQAFRTDRFTGWIVDQGKIALEDKTSLVAIQPVP